MQYEDTIRIATPEGIELELALPGIGSRLAARLIDLLIIGVLVLVGLIVYGSAVDDSSFAGAAAAVVGVLLGFLMMWAYDVLLETFDSGRTPGKRALGIRVVGDRGEPESFSAAAVRNLLRPIDEALTLWIAALISITRSPRNQRLGDIAAGAIVVKDRAEAAGVEAAAVSLGSIDMLGGAAAWDATAITDDDLSAARRFLERRSALGAGPRARLASELAGRLRPKVHGADPTIDAERFIELLVAVKAGR